MGPYFFGSARIALVSLLLAVTLSGGVSAQVSFGKTDYSVDLNPQDVAAADLDRDGVPDLVTANGGGSISVLLGNGDGTFGSAGRFNTGGQPAGIELGDFNGDGLTDTAVANSAGSNLALLLGRGDGSFAAPISVPSGAASNALVAADLNRDGILDLAVLGSSAITILVGNGNGTFHSGTAISVTHPRPSLTAGDFNADNIPDLAYVTCCGGVDVEIGEIWVLLGRGDGSFNPVKVRDLSVPTAVLAAEMNGDRLSDLVVPYQGCHTPCEGVVVLLSNGDGMFRDGTGASIDTLQYGNPGGPAVADFNGDGVNDVAVTTWSAEDDLALGPGEDDVLVWLRASNGNFGPQQDVIIGRNTGPVALAAADFNHDGRVDLASANLRGNTVSVLLNSASSVPGPPPGGGSFTLSATPATATVIRGSSATYIVTLNPANFSGSVSLSCSGLPQWAQCSFNPNPVAVSGAASSTLTISTTGASTAVLWPTALLALGLPGIAAVILPSTRRRNWPLIVLAMVLMLVAVMAGCSGSDAQADGISGPPLAGGTPAGSYNVTITGAAGNLQNSTNITLVVQ